MSKKAKKRGTARCYCGKALGRKARRCPRCDRMTLRGQRASLRKAAATGRPAFLGKVTAAGRGPAFLGKSAGPARAAARLAYCVKGHPNRPGANCCAACGDLMPGTGVPPVGMVGKSALASEFWRRQLESSPDPGMRELYYRALYGKNGNGVA